MAKDIKMKTVTIATKLPYRGAKWVLREMTEAKVIAEAEELVTLRGETLQCHTDIEWVGVGNVDEYGDYFDFAPSRAWREGEQLLSAMLELRLHYGRAELFCCDDEHGRECLEVFKGIEGVE